MLEYGNIQNEPKRVCVSVKDVKCILRVHIETDDRERSSDTPLLYTSCMASSCCWVGAMKKTS